MTPPVFADVDGSGANRSVAQHFGFLPTAATYPVGPFLRPITRELTVSATVTRQPGFPADGLEQMRTAITQRVAQYQVGEQIWGNDLLLTLEAVAGTRITNFTVQFGGADISGAAVPLSTLWSLPTANLALTLT